MLWLKILNDYRLIWMWLRWILILFLLQWWFFPPHTCTVSFIYDTYCEWKKPNSEIIPNWLQITSKSVKIKILSTFYTVFQYPFHSNLCKNLRRVVTAQVKKYITGVIWRLSGMKTSLKVHLQSNWVTSLQRNSQENSWVCQRGGGYTFRSLFFPSCPCITLFPFSFGVICLSCCHVVIP